MREVKRTGERFAELDQARSGKIEVLDDPICEVLLKCTRTATSPSGIDMMTLWDEFPIVDKADEALVLTLEPLFKTDPAQCLAKCKALSEVLGCGVVFRAITWVFKGLLDTTVTGGERQREIDGDLEILGCLLMRHLQPWWLWSKLMARHSYRHQNLV